MSPDRWGIDHRYVDATGTERRVSRRAVEELRQVMGEPEPARDGLIVARHGGRRRLGPGEIALEGGGSVTVTDRLPRSVANGYHSFTDRRGRTRPLIVAPRRCHLPDGWRAWGWSSQLYATRSRRSWGMGDLGDLSELATWSARSGAGFVLLNPLGAATPSEPQEPSPYFPTSRRMRNPIYLRVEDVPGAAAAPEVLEEAARVAQAANLRRIIDRDEVWRHKRRALEAIWASEPPTEEFERWRRRQPAVLEQFARWNVLVERHGARWRDWPADCRRPDSPGVEAVAREEPERVAFHAWLQWLVAEQLARAGGPVALIQDVPIGVDPEGFDAWTWQDLFASGVTVGAPPDEFNQRGQDWGLPPFIPWRLRDADYEPFIETIRSALGGGGGLRIDHVMGLFRLWWIPAGSAPGDGAYVRYPSDELLAILALESERHGALVVGEDLGTVEPSMRAALADHDVLSYRLLWFEEDPPASWPARAMAAVTTHDLPTVAGLWTGRDLEEQTSVGVEPNVESTEALRTRLVRSGDLTEEAEPEDAVRAAYRLLAASPCTLLGATLDDAVAEPQRPNIPGSKDRPNWCLALPVSLEELEHHLLATEVAALLDSAVATEDPEGPNQAMAAEELEDR